MHSGRACENLLLAIVSLAWIDAKRANNEEHTKSALEFLASDWYSSILDWLDIDPTWLDSQVKTRQLPRQRYFHVFTTEHAKNDEPEIDDWLT
jgi:hypothetical protein